MVVIIILILKKKYDFHDFIDSHMKFKYFNDFCDYRVEFYDFHDFHDSHMKL